MSIYVETMIRAPIGDVWRHTQDPALHQQWDLRFTEIQYLLRPSEQEPQRFRYATRIGFGLPIRGEGESVGTRDGPDGSRTSALTFSSTDPRSLILEGSGYWKYVPIADGVRFFTWYDYRTRFGRSGRWVDRLIFRPMMGWATAWSFDRLRLWLEKGITPDLAIRYAAARAIARLGLVVIFVYHGLVPKLLGPHPDEIGMLRDAGLSAGHATRGVLWLGIGELVFAAMLILWWRHRWPALASLGFAIMATLAVALTSPRYLGAAFNPVSLNVSVACLAMIDLLMVSVAPSAGRCTRTQRGTAK